jgi:hypothetical protein
MTVSLTPAPRGRGDSERVARDFHGNRRVSANLGALLPQANRERRCPCCVPPARPGFSASQLSRRSAPLLSARREERLVGAPLAVVAFLPPHAYKRIGSWRCQRVDPPNHAASRGAAVAIRPSRGDSTTDSEAETGLITCRRGAATALGIRPHERFFHAGRKPLAPPSLR